jgi:hypothetical protein
VLLGLQPLTTTAVTILSSLWLVTSRLQSYPLRVLPAIVFMFAGMARSYKTDDFSRAAPARGRPVGPRRFATTLPHRERGRRRRKDAITGLEIL